MDEKRYARSDSLVQFRRHGNARVSEGLNEGLEMGSDFGESRVGREGDRGADVNDEFAEVGEAAALLLHLPDAVKAHGDDGDTEILGEQADARLEGDHVRRVAVVDDAFGKDEKAVATIDGFAGESETFPKAGKLRKREYVEERDDEEVVELPEPAFGEEPFAGRIAEGLQSFAANGCGDLVAET